MPDCVRGFGRLRWIVDCRPLVEQWRDRLVTHLDLTAKQVGVLGGARSKPTGVVDIATVQTLARRDRPDGPLSWFGGEYDDEQFRRLMIDECRLIYGFDVQRSYGMAIPPP